MHKNLNFVPKVPKYSHRARGIPPLTASPLVSRTLLFPHPLYSLPHAPPPWIILDHVKHVIFLQTFPRATENAVRKHNRLSGKDNIGFPAHFRHLCIQFHQFSIQFRPEKLTPFKP